MRIIHGHDYYDSALAYGSDPDVVFVREKNHILDADQIRPIPGLFGAGGNVYFIGKRATYQSSFTKFIPLPNGDSFHLDSFRIWVADKSWWGWRIQDSTGVTCFYSWEGLSRWAESHSYSVIRPMYSYRVHRHTVSDSIPHEMHDSSDQLQAWMIQNRVTVITLVDDWPHTARVNGDNLKEFQMFRVMDAFSMFQLISGWVGGVLPRNPNPMVEITDDKIKSHKHGFDKWSFRKLPSK